MNNENAGDVLDLAWSSQDRWLASSSVDNNIIVWDMNNLPTMVAILKGHSGLVKGVTWDPVKKNFEHFLIGNWN